MIKNNFNEIELDVALGSVDSLIKQLQAKQVDSLVCNILAPVTKELAPDFDHLVSKEGNLLLSGLLVDQVEDITSFFSILGWRAITSYQSENWALIHLCSNRS